MKIVREIVREIVHTISHTICLTISASKNCFSLVFKGSLMIWGAEVMWEIVCTHFPCRLDLFWYHGGLGGEEKWKL